MGNGNPHTQLKRVYNDTIPLESILAIASKFKDAPDSDLAVPFLDAYCRMTLVNVHMQTCTRIVIIVSFETIRECNLLSFSRGINKIPFNLFIKMDYYITGD